MESVEDIILRNEMMGVSSSRGISRLRRYLPPDFCRQAAQKLLGSRENDDRRKILLVTGFYIRDAETFETDGPPGAIMLADALWKLGIVPLIVTDDYAAGAIRKSCNHHVYTFPIVDEEKSNGYVSELLRLGPSAVVAIERCGRGSDGTYRNMKGIDISGQTARIDKIFLGKDIPTIGVGDGGNEIGMGNVADEVRAHKVHDSPSSVMVDDLVIATVSNWGAYGIVAYLSQITERNDLFTSTETDIVSRLIQHGAVDGITGKRELSVDTFPTTAGDSVINDLKAVSLTPARAA